MNNNIHVFDDLIPDWLYQNTLKNIAQVPVTFGHSGLGPYQGHSLFSKVWRSGEIASVPWYLTATFECFKSQGHRLGQLADITMSQCQINMSTQNLNGGLHVDSNPAAPAWTMVHMIAGDSGMDFWTALPEQAGTLIKQVEYRDNRCVVFPSALLHRGLPPKSVEPRVTVGYIFSGTSPSQFASRNNIIFPIFRREYDRIMQGGSNV